MQQTTKISSKTLAIIALLIFVPAPSIGVIFALYLGDGLLGVILWIFAKAWLFLGPLAWLIWIEQMPLSLSPPKKGGLWMGTLFGIGVFVIIIGSYLLFAHGNIDLDNFRHKLSTVGLTNKNIYLIACTYWILINSLLEEYVFRFFLFRQSEKIWPNLVAIMMTALFFTIHHTLALATYLPWWQNILASFGIFCGSLIWSGLYARYRSIWPGYICHVFADIAIFSIGWFLLF